MVDDTVTRRRSLIGTFYYFLIRFSGLKNKLAKDDIQKLQSYSDTKTPAEKGYQKEVIGAVAIYWINKEKIENGILVYLPGGGFIIGPTRLHWNYSENMSKKLDMAVIVVQYPLAPQHPFPEGLNEITNAIITLQSRGILNKKWFFAGESAGGNLTLAACYELYRLKAGLPQKIMLLYPSVDMSEGRSDEAAQKVIAQDIVLSLGFTQRVLAAYAVGQNLKNPLLSPANGSVAVLPPVLLQHGTSDILIQGSEKLVANMRAAGKFIYYEKYKGMFHGFILYPGLPEAKKAIRSQIAFLKK